jgi:very-short-patch-repair endonuclease
MVIRNGLPRPETQIPVFADDGLPIAYLDMGWPEWMVAIEYDGDQHRTDRRQYVKDIRRYEMLERMGWIIVRVIAEDRPADIIRRIRAALELRA